MIKQYEENIVRVDKLYNKKNNNFDAFKNVIELTKSEYYQKINVLKDEERDKISVLRKKNDRIQENIKKDIDTLNPHIDIVERIFKFIEIMRYEAQTPTNILFDVEMRKSYKGYSHKILETFSNDYISWKVVITENDKPVNKYSLSLIGKHIFNDLVPLNRSYITNLSTCWLNIERWYVDKPIMAELELWYRKNKATKIQDDLNIYQMIESEYKNAIKNHITDDWLIAFYEWKLRYFINHNNGFPLESKNYYYDAYIKISNELEQLKNKVFQMEVN